MLHNPPCLLPLAGPHTPWPHHAPGCPIPEEHTEYLYTCAHDLCSECPFPPRTGRLPKTFNSSIRIPFKHHSGSLKTPLNALGRSTQAPAPTVQTLNHPSAWLAIWPVTGWASQGHKRALVFYHIIITNSHIVDPDGRDAPRELCGQKSSWRLGHWVRAPLTFCPVYPPKHPKFLQYRTQYFVINIYAEFT